METRGNLCIELGPSVGVYVIQIEISSSNSRFHAPNFSLHRGKSSSICRKLASSEFHQPVFQSGKAQCEAIDTKIIFSVCKETYFHEKCFTPCLLEIERFWNSEMANSDYLLDVCSCVAGPQGPGPTAVKARTEKLYWEQVRKLYKTAKVFVVLTPLRLAAVRREHPLVATNSAFASQRTTIPLLFSAGRGAQEMLNVVSFSSVVTKLSGPKLGANKKKKHSKI